MSSGWQLEGGLHTLLQGSSASVSLETCQQNCPDNMPATVDRAIRETCPGNTSSRSCALTATPTQHKAEAPFSSGQLDKPYQRQQQHNMHAVLAKPWSRQRCGMLKGPVRHALLHLPRADGRNNMPPCTMRVLPPGHNSS